MPPNSSAVSNHEAPSLHYSHVTGLISRWNGSVSNESVTVEDPVGERVRFPGCLHFLRCIYMPFSLMDMSALSQAVCTPFCHSLWVCVCFSMCWSQVQLPAQAYVSTAPGNMNTVLSFLTGKPGQCAAQAVPAIGRSSLQILRQSDFTTGDPKQGPEPQSLLGLVGLVTLLSQLFTSLWK